MKLVSVSLLGRMAFRSMLASALITSLSASAQQPLSADRVELRTQAESRLLGALDAGAVPGSEPMTLTVTLAQTADRQVALAQRVAAQTTPGSPEYHVWLTPEQVAEHYGATAEQLTAAEAWAKAQGLTVDAISPSGMRMSLSGTAVQVQSALAVSLHQYKVAGKLFVANSNQPSLPAEVSGLFTGIEGLSTLPAASGDGLSAAAREAGASAVTRATDFGSLAALVDRNAAAVVTLHSSLCAADLSEAQRAEYTLLLEQADAQGMSLLVEQGCAAGAFPASLSQVTAVASGAAGMLDTTAPVTVRPGWQSAPGLPADAFRHQPDLTASSVDALAQTLLAIVARTGVRQGNVAPVLYALAPLTGLYTQPDGQADRWEGPTGLGLVDLDRLAKAYPQGSTGSSLQVTPSAYSLLHGGSFTVAATVAGQSGSAVPSGTVTFSSTQAGFVGSSAMLNPSGTATSVPYQVPGGSYSITATYTGDGTYAASSATTNVTVQAEAANFSISTPATVALGGTIMAAVTLGSSSGFGTPTGTVTVTPNGLLNTGSATEVLSGSNGLASASFSFVANRAGSISLQATCTSGDSSFTCYTQPSSSTAVGQATPSVVLSSSTNSPSAGSPVTFTANVTGVAGIPPTGSVQFLDGSSVIGNGNTFPAAVSVTLAPGVKHSITAVYSGDANYLGETSKPINPSVGTASTTVAAVASSASFVYGTAGTLTVTITPSATVNGAAPTGTLTFTGAGSITTATVAGTTTVVPLSTLPAGTYSIGVNYSGDSNYGASSTAAAVSFTVTPATGTLTSQPSTTFFTTGSNSTLTEQIQLPGNTQLMAGSTFTATVVGTGQSYTGTFNINPGGNTGTGSVKLLAPAAGNYTVTVTCSAGSNIVCPPSSFAITSTATGTTTTGTVATTTTLTASSLAPVAGTATTLTATVAVAAGGALSTPISGSVAFFDGSTQLGTVPLQLVGAVETAVLPVTLTGSVTHSITAAYNGDPVYAASTSSVLSVVTAASPAAISLTSSSTSGLAGSAVIFTARVTGATAAGVTPTGTVSFFLAGPSALLATVPLTSGGAGVAVATFSTTGFPAGNQVVYAVYNGDSNFSAVTSTSITLGFSDYGITLNPTSLTMTQGAEAQSTLTLNFIGGFNGTVTFGCIPPPDTEMTCTYTPPVLSPGSLNYTKLRIRSTAPATQAQTGRSAGLGAGWIGALTGAGLLFTLLPGVRRRRLPRMLVILAALAMTVNLGCSGGTFKSLPGSPIGGTPLGTYVFAISTAGTDGTNTVKHNYSLQVTVTQ